MSDDLFQSTLWVKTQRESYPIHVGYHLLKDSSLFSSLLSQKHVFIISHIEIAAHYLESLTQICHAVGAIRVEHFLIPSGDQHKTLETATQVWEEMLTQHYHRDTVIIGLGGGVVGDLAGFCAACYMRGVNIIQCPTSFLAQIDASIGGKTGVNFPQGKNLIGAFHQPISVIIDLVTLETLPSREYIAGMGELIKYGVALDRTFFVWLEKVMPLLIERDPSVLPQAVKWACSLKAQIVSADEKENNQRLILNFGHTVAHAIESLLNYQQYLHGEAVAIGMVVALFLSLQRGWIDSSLFQRLIALLQKAQLPTTLPTEVTTKQILEKIKLDKKHSQKALQWILLKDLGEPIICADITSKELEIALETCTKPFGVSKR